MLDYIMDGYNDRSVDISLPAYRLSVQFNQYANPVETLNQNDLQIPFVPYPLILIKYQLLVEFAFRLSARIYYDYIFNTLSNY